MAQIDIWFRGICIYLRRLLVLDDSTTSEFKATSDVGKLSADVHGIVY